MQVVSLKNHLSYNNDIQRKQAVSKPVKILRSIKPY